MDTYTTTPKAQSTIEALWRLEKIVLNSLNFEDVVQNIVESTLSELGYLNLGYRVIVLALVDKKTKKLKRISYSRTKEGIEAIGSLSVPFLEIEIPLSEENNLCVKAMKNKQPYVTHSVADVFYPTLKKEEIFPIQNSLGIKTTMVYPVFSRGESIGVLIFSLIKEENEISQEEKDLIAGFTDVVGLAVQNSALYTSLQDATEQLKDANERLKSLDKLKDEFVSLASHELRTPMTSIKSYLWLVLSQRENIGSLSPKQKEYLDRVYISTERLIKLVNDMLNVSRIESGRMAINAKPLDLVTLANDSVKDILPSSQNAGVSILINSPSSQLPQVSADPEKIKEVFINLMGNSLKFTPKGGKITISFNQKDDTVITSITDTGKGIKPEDMSKLFQKFGLIEGNYVAFSSTQGTGLGLYLTKSIIELHGGKISVESEGENKGTTFSFSLKKAQ